MPHLSNRERGGLVGPSAHGTERGWRLMIFCARATRGRGLPSPGLMARFGVPMGGRVRKLRAVEDQSAPIPREITSKLGGSMDIVRFALLGSSQPSLIDVAAQSYFFGDCLSSSWRVRH
jgi:hypothetical protein